MLDTVSIGSKESDDADQVANGAVSIDSRDSDDAEQVANGGCGDQPTTTNATPDEADDKKLGDEG